MNIREFLKLISIVLIFSIISFSSVSFSIEKTYKMQFTEQEVEQIKRVLVYTVKEVDNSKMEHDKVKSIIEGMGFIYQRFDNQVKSSDSTRKK